MQIINFVPPIWFSFESIFTFGLLPPNLDDARNLLSYLEGYFDHRYPRPTFSHARTTHLLRKWSEWPQLHPHECWWIMWRWTMSGSWSPIKQILIYSPSHRGRISPWSPESRNVHISYKLDLLIGSNPWLYYDHKDTHNILMNYKKDSQSNS